MPSHHLRRTRTSRPGGVARAVALALALALLVAGCGGSGKDEPGAADGKKSPSKGGKTSSEPDEPAPDPGFGVPQAGQCFRMNPRQSRASVAAGRRVNCRGQHTTVVAYVGYVPRPVTAQTPLPQRRALGKRVCEPALRRIAGGTLADRATSILTWTLFTPGQAQLERGARWVRCDVLARSGNRLVALPAARPFLKQGVPEQLRVCQDQAGTDVSCSLPHAYRVEAVFRETGQAYPDPTTYTPVARDRCKELMGKYGGFWQPPSRAGWRAGDRFIRCLAPSS
jgi:hypothetical protein